jgi:hypothetical protein
LCLSCGLFYISFITHDSEQDDYFEERLSFAEECAFEPEDYL